MDARLRMKGRSHLLIAILIVSLNWQLPLARSADTSLCVRTHTIPTPETRERLTAVPGTPRSRRTAEALTYLLPVSIVKPKKARQETQKEPLLPSKV
jgi:hypothetical protein